MKVAIIELGGSHVETIYTLVHLLQLKGCEITLVINQKLLHLIYDRSGTKNIKTVPDDLSKLSVQLREFGKLRSFLKKEKIETVIIGTTEIKPVRTLVFFLPVKNIIGIVHHTRKLENGSTFKNILSLKMRKFMVLGDYLLKELKPLSKYIVSSLDAVYFPPVKELKVIKPAHEFWVVIPGMVHSDRRDYLPLIEKLSERPLKRELKIIFLGYLPMEEREIRQALKTWKEAPSHVITFDEYLDYDVFHSYMSQADLVLPLIKMGGDRFYNDSRTSGSLNLGLGYQKPFLLPSSYRNDVMAPFSSYYASHENLVNKLISYSEESGELDSLKQHYNQQGFMDHEKQANDLLRFIRS